MLDVSDLIYSFFCSASQCSIYSAIMLLQSVRLFQLVLHYDLIDHQAMSFGQFSRPITKETVKFHLYHQDLKRQVHVELAWLAIFD